LNYTREGGLNYPREGGLVPRWAPAGERLRGVRQARWVRPSRPPERHRAPAGAAAGMRPWGGPGHGTGRFLDRILAWRS